MLPFDTSGRYGDAAVLAELQASRGTRQLRFRFELLDATNTFKSALSGVLSASVANDTSADVKRTATFTFRDKVDTINFASDRVRPIVQLVMPDGGVVEWPQGVFLLSTPSRSISPSGVITRSVSAYDQLVVLASDAVTDRYSIPAGQLFTDAVFNIVGGSVPSVYVTASTLTLPVTWDYEGGTSKLTILNDLLSAMNYRSARFDENGLLVCEPYVLPEQRTIGYTYATDASSTLVGDVEQDLDLFDVPNKWVLVVSDTDQAALTSTVVNTDPGSPTSTVSRGRTIVSYLDGQSAADQATLNGLAAKQAYTDSQIYESVAFSTAIMPFHSDHDMIGVVVNGLDLGSIKYEELSWAFDLQAGATMSHTVRRSVSVFSGATS